MEKYLIDTDILIDILKGKYGLDGKLNQVRLSNCYISEITLAELHFGLSNSSERLKHQSEPTLAAEYFKVVPITDVLELYGQEKARLKRQGDLLPDFDILIAVTAVHYGYILVTGNTKHHQRIENIVIENWRLKDYNDFA
jgi:tRNA(fMet)-specific endonuclease VapC